MIPGVKFQSTLSVRRATIANTSLRKQFDFNPRSP
ncbi:hypothetical protein BIFADO_02341 [Bifidobacterium adolescentis L2-32]|uniref:Uncharacterized protein n=1 Tax=Bifidobacterium adolescentis L2-32 TaxID=411481 RepID=A7A8Z8_BIFAD|nr:hypothetical protein BIFADO_02341 [Bifidobacterium adolescentis L2-32]